MNKYFRINSKKVIVNLLIFSLIIFFISVIFSNKFNTEYTTQFIDKNIVELNNNWIIKNKNTNNKDTVDLPINLKFSHNTTYSFSKILDMNFSDDANMLCLRTGFSNLNVYLNDKIIYNFSNKNYDKFLNMGKNTLHIIKLPSGFQNKKLKFEMTMLSNYSLSYDIQTPLIGTKTSIIYNLISSQLLNYIILFLMINFTVIIFIILGIALYKNKKDLFHLFSIGIFAFLASTYSISETNIMQLLVPNTYLLNDLTFMSLILVSIPIMMIMMEITNKKYTKTLVSMIYLMLTNFIIQSFLKFLGIFDFRSMLFISHILIITNGIICLSIIINSKNNRSLGSKCFTLSIIPMIIGTLIDISLFYLHISAYYGICFQIGVLIFIIIQLWYVINTYFNYYCLSIQSSIYEKMAFTDSMTSIENRAAFEKKIIDINENLNSYDSIWCLSMDLNNLKEINDTLGHSSGDDLIASFAKIIKDNFYKIGNCYRTGGDEFIVILCNVSQSNLENKLNNFYIMIQDHNSNSSLKINTALGYDNFKFNEDQNLTDLISRADNLMYANKNDMKKILNMKIR